MKRVTRMSLRTAPKKELHTSCISTLIGREKEFKLFSESIQNLITKNESCCMYVSGSPGTGKSFTISNVIDEMKKSYSFNLCSINCYSVESSSKIYLKICDILGIKCSTKSSQQILQSIEKYFNSTQKKTVIVLDEIDYLNSKNQNILYELYSWPSKFDSKVMLIGIANSLDLTERLLPNIIAMKHVPKHISFSPYSPADIIQIVTKRLSDAIVDETAIKLCAKKISSSSGDIRRALAVCQKAISIANTDPANKENQNPNVTFRHVLKALHDCNSDVIGGDKKGCRRTLPLQHKMVLSSMMLIKKDRKMSNIPLGLLNDMYKEVCGQQGLPELDMSELASVCESLSSYGLVRIHNPASRASAFSTPSRKKSVQLLLDDKSLQTELNDNELFASIMATKIK